MRSELCTITNCHLDNQSELLCKTISCCVCSTQLCCHCYCYFQSCESTFKRFHTNRQYSRQAKPNTSSESLSVHFEFKVTSQVQTLVFRGTGTQVPPSNENSELFHAQSNFCGAMLGILMGLHVHSTEKSCLWMC